MGFRDDLTKRIEKKRSEIIEMQGKLREAGSYLQALEDMLKMVPRDQQDGGSSQSRVDTLRPSSAVARARDLIRKAGRPLHIEDLLKGLGRPVTKGTRAALSGSIATYVRKGEIFSKTAPNTFGLREMKSATTGDVAESDAMTEELPPSFGLDDELGEEVENTES